MQEIIQILKNKTNVQLTWCVVCVKPIKGEKTFHKTIYSWNVKGIVHPKMNMPTHTQAIEDID